MSGWSACRPGYPRKPIPPSSVRRHQRERYVPPARKVQKAALPSPVLLNGHGSARPDDLKLVAQAGAHLKVGDVVIVAVNTDVRRVGISDLGRRQCILRTIRGQIR